MELNKVTIELLDAGYSQEDTPPGMRPYDWFYGGWTYAPETLHQMVFETPCGLLVEGNHFVSGMMSYMGVDWMPENDNPTVTCPRFDLLSCKQNHELLREHRHSGDIVHCACHKTDRPYEYERSYDKAHDDVWAEADRLFPTFDAQKGGRACKHQSRYNRRTKTWYMHYDPQDCVHYNCCYCRVLQTELSPIKGNVYYDRKVTCTVKGFGLFPDEKKISITKGIRLLDKTASLTLCEAICKYAMHRIVKRVRGNYHTELIFNPDMRIELLNFRAERRNTRDLMQDLQDAAEGIEVVHDADTIKAKKMAKHERRELAEQRRIARLEGLITKYGFDGLGKIEQCRATKKLSDERIEELEWNRRHMSDEPRQISFYNTED